MLEKVLNCILLSSMLFTFGCVFKENTTYLHIVNQHSQEKEHKVMTDHLHAHGLTAQTCDI